MQGLFPGFTIVNLQETTLGGNQFKRDFNRLSWNVSGIKNFDNQNDVLNEESVSYSAIQFMPMEIRTFILELGRV
jgi:lysosomal alpha-mannosidase